MRLYGKRSVAERIRTNPKTVKKIYLQEASERPEIIDVAKKHGIPIETITRKRFFQLSQNAHTQGIMAEAEVFGYADFDAMIAAETKEKPTLVCLDRINDPQNLGVILRNLACFGGFCVVLPKHESVEVTEAVIKVACGAENHVPVCKVTNLANALIKAQENGYWTAATVVEKGEHPRKIKFNFPLAVVFGSEGEGIRPGLLKHIDYKLTLPMKGAQLSFNVAMAVGMFCYEISCQRDGLM